MCELCEGTRFLPFHGGPANGLQFRVRDGIPELIIPALVAGAIIEVPYKRHELSGGPAMVFEGTWPLPRARE